MSALAERLKLSNAEAERLTAWAASPKLEPTTTESELARRLYRSGRQPIVDRLRTIALHRRGRAPRPTTTRWSRLAAIPGC